MTNCLMEEAKKFLQEDSWYTAFWEEKYVLSKALKQARESLPKRSKHSWSQIPFMQLIQFQVFFAKSVLHALEFYPFHVKVEI